MRNYAELLGVLLSSYASLLPDITVYASRRAGEQVKRISVPCDALGKLDYYPPSIVVLGSSDINELEALLNEIPVGILVFVLNVFDNPACMRVLSAYARMGGVVKNYIPVGSGIAVIARRDFDSKFLS